MKKSKSNPFNYTGSKFRYLDDIMAILPKEKSLTVCDPFLGGGDLATNLPVSWRVHASDVIPQLVEMHQSINDGVINTRDVALACYNADLNKINRDEYFKFRDEYNKKPTAIGLYMLLCHANSNRIRFSSNGYNVPFGERNFNLNMQAKLDNYIDRLGERNINFKYRSYNDIDFSSYDLLLIDPPYLGSDATYNSKWTELEEIELHEKVAMSGKRFIYFGQIFANGYHNTLLDNFSQKYNVKILRDTTKHCSANRGKGKTIEVMIYNF